MTRMSTQCRNALLKSIRVVADSITSKGNPELDDCRMIDLLTLAYSRVVTVTPAHNVGSPSATPSPPPKVTKEFKDKELPEGGPPGPGPKESGKEVKDFTKEMKDTDAGIYNTPDAAPPIGEPRRSSAQHFIGPALRPDLQAHLWSAEE